MTVGSETRHIPVKDVPAKRPSAMTGFRFVGHPERDVMLLEVCVQQGAWSCDHGKTKQMWEKIARNVYKALPDDARSVIAPVNPKNCRTRFDTLMAEDTDGPCKNEMDEKRRTLIRNLQDKVSTLFTIIHRSYKPLIIHLSV